MGKGTLKKIVYVGPTDGYVGSSIRTTESRRRGLESIGLEVITFDCTDFAGKNRWMRHLNHRFYIGPSVRKQNADLVRFAADVKPDLVWFDKGSWIYPRTLLKLKKHARYLVHYNTDDTFARANYLWLHRNGIRHADIYLTTNRWNVEEIRKSYGVRAVRAGMGYDFDAYRPSPTKFRESERLPIVFVGHWEPHSESFLSVLLERGHSVHVWGSHWRNAKNPALRSSTVLHAKSYVETISKAKIALCFLSRHNRNESTGRSFEIPAIGAFMLAEWTPEHEYLYGDGLGAALFSDEDELIQKAEHYLSHPQDLQQVAREGHERCLDLGLSWQEHMHREWALIERMLVSGDDVVGPCEDDKPFWAGYRVGMAYVPQKRALFSSQT